MGVSAVQAIRARRWGAWALAASTGVLSIAAALTLGGSAFGPLDLATAKERRAELEAAKAEIDPAAVRRTTLETLGQAPLTASAWLRLAWLADRDGRVSERNAMLDRSYAVAPFGPDVTAWRLGFAYQAWSTLTPELRRQAGAELVATLATRGRLAREIEATIDDPSGRLAYGLSVRAFDIRSRLQAENAQPESRSGATVTP